MLSNHKKSLTKPINHQKFLKLSSIICYYTIISKSPDHQCHRKKGNTRIGESVVNIFAFK